MNIDKLESLKKELEQYNDLINQTFKTKEELRRFRENNLERFNQLIELKKQIDKLEWELKSPEEQAQILEQRRLSRLKREGKLFDEMDN